MNYWFTSDYHIGHPNIIRFNNRPWKTITEHDEGLIATHNAIVYPGDVVYFLGDLTLNRDPKYVEGIIKQLNGRIHFCLGNHDKAHISCYVKNCEWVGQAKKVRIADKDIWLSHYEHAVWPHSHFNSWHLFGHAHTLRSLSVLKGKKHCVNVDFNDYKPISFDQVIEIVKKKPDNWDVIGGQVIEDRYKKHGIRKNIRLQT